MLITIHGEVKAKLIFGNNVKESYSQKVEHDPGMRPKDLKGYSLFLV